jgi:hypothetical protein
LEALYELYLITGDADYRDALLFDWHSILKTDIHNNGSFSTNERAVGNPFKSGAIETCCTVSWMALSIDALKLSKDSKVADQLESSTWNAVLAYQHPSGRWCTYHTPMDGWREASAHSIVFQSRAGTPELNCCSVNGPKGIGMISEWAVLEDANGLYLNHYGPGEISVDSGDAKWKFTQDTRYPSSGRIKLKIDVDHPTEETIHLRIPEWSVESSVEVNGQPVEGVTPGAYLAIRRTWNAGDTVDLALDMNLRHLKGDENVGNRVSFYYGPLLLAYDQRFNQFDPNEIEPLNGQQLEFVESDAPQGQNVPLKLIKFQAEGSQELVLCDFATAGSLGTYYRSWLPAKNLGLGPFYLTAPETDGVFPVGQMAFTWGKVGPDVVYDFILAKDEAMSDIVLKKEGLTENSIELSSEVPAGPPLYWDVVARIGQEEQHSSNGPWKIEVSELFQPLFSTSFEQGQPQPAPIDKPYAGQSTADAKCYVDDSAGVDGTPGLVLSGNDLSAELSYVCLT